jgi:hypothetical protein
MNDQGTWIANPVDWIAGIIAVFLILVGAFLRRYIPDWAGGISGFGMGIVAYNLLRIFLFDKVSIGFAKACKNVLVVIFGLVVLMLFVFIKEPSDALGMFAHNAVFMLSVMTAIWLILLTPSYFKQRDEYQKAESKEVEKVE